MNENMKGLLFNDMHPHQNVKQKKHQKRIHRKIKVTKSQSAAKKASNKSPRDKAKILSLPWSSTISLGHVAQLDSLEFVYGLKNRDDALDLVMASSKSIKQLVQALGTKGEEKYKLNYKLFILKHKDKANKHYQEFYTSKKK